jgi:hypothetical protein
MIFFPSRQSLPAVVGRLTSKTKRNSLAKDFITLNKKPETSAGWCLDA